MDDPLRIAVLAAGLRVGGGLTVGLNMTAALGRVGPQHEYFCVVPAKLGYEEAARSMPTCRLLIHEHKGYLRRWLFETFVMTRAVRAFRPDVIFAMSGRGLVNPGCPQAAFPQKPHFFYPPKYYGKLSWPARLGLAYRRRYFARQLRRTQLVMVQTEVVARRLREGYGYRGRVLVCSTAVTPSLRQGANQQPVPEALRPLADKLKLLYLTRYYPHKNLEGIVELFRRHGPELRDVAVITTVGADQHPGAPGYLEAIDRYRLSDQIINVGPIPHDQVGAYYQHCDALFMPTLLETFGIPYLEAMCFDLPIITSDLDFARAVCGDAALYFDPWNPAAARDAVLRLKSDPDLRNRLIAAGRQRLNQDYPSWDEITADVLGQLRAIVEESGSDRTVSQR